MPTAKPVIKAIAKLHGYALFRRFLDRSQWWSIDQRDAWIADRLKSTLVAALAVPFYREAFARVGFDPRVDFKSPRDLASLPILTKQQVRRQQARLFDPASRTPFVVAHTSGTTGEPLAMRASEPFLAFEAACIFRHWSWAGYRLRQPVAAIRTYVPKHEGDPLWRYSWTENAMYFSAYHLTPQSCEQYLEQVIALRPAIIRGYPSSMMVFAELAYPRRHDLSFVKGIIMSSETLLPNERETIERTFGKRVFDWYGMTEPAVILTECERHEGVHVNWEYGYAEVLPSDELPPDEGRLVTTGFHNPLMPFIRYETGDVVRTFADDRRCSCGRTMPLLHSIAGRKDECVVTPDGRRLPSLNFYMVFRKYGEIARFQVTQVAVGEIVVRIDPRPGATVGPDLLRVLREELMAGIGPGVVMAIELDHRFVTNRDGKAPPIVGLTGT